MIPGEIQVEPGEIELNAGRETIRLTVANTGDRPIQVGSHYHFAETNSALAFDRAAARGFRLDIAAGTAVRFEPGQMRSVPWVARRWWINLPARGREASLPLRSTGVLPPQKQNQPHKARQQQNKQRQAGAVPSNRR